MASRGAYYDLHSKMPEVADSMNKFVPNHLEFVQRMAVVCLGGVTGMTRLCHALKVIILGWHSLKDSALHSSRVHLAISEILLLLLLLCLII